MTSIPLRTRTVAEYLNCDRYRLCQEISRIHVSSHDRVGNITVEASIPASSSNQGRYNILIWLENGGKGIKATSCSCPVGLKCKHICKVLCRIVNSKEDPLPGPTKHQRAQLEREKLKAKQFRRGACVYIAFACQSELDSGSDYRRSRLCKDKFDEKLLGVFFSVSHANKCARDYVEDELGVDCGGGEEDDEEDDESDEEDEEEFVWDGSDYDIYEGIEFDKVWVECRAIEDASRRFRP